MILLPGFTWFLFPDFLELLETQVQVKYEDESQGSEWLFTMQKSERKLHEITKY